MPVADYKIYCEMFKKAREGHYAYPAFNVTSLTTANAVLKGLAESRSDGIIQVSTGGGAFASGSSVKDMALGAISIAEHVHRAAERYPVCVALHTDHCQDAVVKKYGEEARFYLVFHGGSGSELRDIHESLDYGVIKMNIDTDTQYAFTRPIADHMLKNYSGVLKVDGEVGDKKAYDFGAHKRVIDNLRAA
jgi:fructose/tagatose bisphosphate aldolase